MPRRCMADDQSAWFEGIWKARDEAINAVFGQAYRDSICKPTLERLSAILPTVDPLWLHNGVFAYPPTAERQSWCFVTAGLSTPWELGGREDLPSEPASEPSGLGFELVVELETFDETGSDYWAIWLLNTLMAYQLGVANNLLPGKRIAPGHWIPLKGLGCWPTDTTSPIDAVATVTPKTFPAVLNTPSGFVELIQLVGITDTEWAWALENTVEALTDALFEKFGGVTIFQRPALEQTQGHALPESLRSHTRTRTAQS